MLCTGQPACTAGYLLPSFLPCSGHRPLHACSAAVLLMQIASPPDMQGVPESSGFLSLVLVSAEDSEQTGSYP